VLPFIGLQIIGLLMVLFIPQVAMLLPTLLH
jgi:TRAP-type C4-dicarboxylate transport system permease large subunit